MNIENNIKIKNDKEYLELKLILKKLEKEYSDEVHLNIKEFNPPKESIITEENKDIETYKRNKNQYTDLKNLFINLENIKEDTPELINEIEKKYNEELEYYNKKVNELSIHKKVLENADNLVENFLNTETKILHIYPKKNKNQNDFRYHHAFSPSIDNIMETAKQQFKRDIICLIKALESFKHPVYENIREGVLLSKINHILYDINQSKKRIKEEFKQKEIESRINKKIEYIVSKLKERGYLIEKIKKSPYSESKYIYVKHPNTKVEDDYDHYHKIRVSDHEGSYKENSLVKIKV